MRKIDAEIVREAERYTRKLMEEKLSAEYLFHSRKHTLNVVHNAVHIGRNCSLTEDEMNVLQVSAYFHDIGYILTDESHEKESCFIATEFLRAQQVSEEAIEVVCNAILSTRVPQKPNDLISMVLCDADLMHLAGDDYFEQMELLRLEWQVTGKFFFTEYQFHLNSIEFFRNHSYHSDYGKKVMQPLKEYCLQRILDRVECLRN